MKKIIAAVLAALTMCSVSAFAANNEPKVFLDDTEMTFDVNPFIENDRTLVPMRAIFEAVGAVVEWDGDNKTVHAVREKNGETSVVSLQIGTASAFVNSEKTELDVPAQIKDDRTFVPLRFVVEALGEKVEWDGASYSVKITTSK